MNDLECWANVILSKYTVKYSDDKGKTVKESGNYSEQYLAVDFANKMKRKEHVVYGLFKNGKRL